MTVMKNKIGRQSDKVNILIEELALSKVDDQIAIDKEELERMMQVAEQLIKELKELRKL